MANSHAKAVRTQGISEYSYIYIYLNKYSSVILRAGMRTRGRGISLKSESRRSFWFGINKTAEELRRFAQIWSSFFSCRWASLSTSGALFIGGSEPRAPEKDKKGEEDHWFDDAVIISRRRLPLYWFWKDTLTGYVSGKGKVILVYSVI